MPKVFVIGNVNVDLILGPHDQWPHLGTEVLVDTMDLRVGGSAGNSLLALRGIGADAHVIANVGWDSFGAWLRQELHGIQGTWLTSTAPTSVTVALSHVTGERTFFTFLGHLSELSWPDIERAVSTVSANDVILLSGVFLTPALRRDYPKLLRALKSRGARLAIDPGWPPEGWTDAVRDELRGWLAWCDDVLLNDQELCAFIGRTDVHDAAHEALSSLPSTATLVVKRGADGASAWSERGAVHVDAPAVAVIDTVGAGDTFNAAYLWALVCGASTERALAEGTRVASHAISTTPRQFVPPSAGTLPLEEPPEHPSLRT